MSSADTWFAEATRRERARVRAKSDLLLTDLSTLGQRAYRKHPIVSLVVATATGIALARVAGKRARNPTKSRRRGMITSSIAGAVQSYLLHLFTSSLAGRPTRRA